MYVQTAVGVQACHLPGLKTLNKGLKQFLGSEDAIYQDSSKPFLGCKDVIPRIQDITLIRMPELLLFFLGGGVWAMQNPCPCFHLGGRARLELGLRSVEKRIGHKNMTATSALPKRVSKWKVEPRSPTFNAILPLQAERLKWLLKAISRISRMLCCINVFRNGWIG